MKNPIITGLLAVLLFNAAVVFAQESPQIPEMPKPVKQHEWLQKLVGSWETEGEVQMAPDQPAMKTKGTEKVRALGGFWVVSEGSGEMEGMPGPMNYIMTLGYDPEKNKYIGTWVDSMTNHLWSYEGTVDSTGKILTLEAEGPCPMRPGEMTKFRDVTEFVDENTRVFTSSMHLDGKWVKTVTGKSRRKG